MMRDNISLNKIKIAAPCPAEWRFMYGNDRVRFCGQCSLNVYNLSAMTEEEAEDLIRRTEERLCVRFYRREDGSILTRNCPVGLQAIKDKFTSTRNHLIAALLSLFAYIGILLCFRGERRQPPVSEPKPIQAAYRGSTTTGVLMRPISESGVVERSEDFIRQHAIFKVTPVAHSVNDAGIRGDTVVRIRISEAGEVKEANCIEGHPLLSSVAEEAAKRWKFEPVFDRGIPSSVESTLTFHFGR